MNPIDFKGQGHCGLRHIKAKNPCEQHRRQINDHRNIKPSTNVSHGERMNPIDFQGQGSTVKVTVDLGIFRQKILVNSIEDKAIIIETSNLPQMFPLGRG